MPARAERCCAAPGYEEPVYLHGALPALVELYERLGVRARAGAAGGRRSRATTLKGKNRAGAAGGRGRAWARRLPDPVVAMASGWMRVRQRAKQRGVELPLVISDHADWDELTATIDEVAAERGLGDARRRGGAGAPGDADGLSRPRAVARRLRGGG